MLMIRRFRFGSVSFASSRGRPVRGSIMSRSRCCLSSSSLRSARNFERPISPSASSILPSKLRSKRRSNSSRVSAGDDGFAAASLVPFPGNDEVAGDGPVRGGACAVAVAANSDPQSTIIVSPATAR